MTEQNERRVKQLLSYDAVVDRRQSDREGKLKWERDVIPGTIRPGVNDKWDGIERRYGPGTGEE
jgi:hypothetical protein